MEKFFTAPISQPPGLDQPAVFGHRLQRIEDLLFIAEVQHIDETISKLMQEATGKVCHREPEMEQSPDKSAAPCPAAGNDKMPGQNLLFNELDQNINNLLQSADATEDAMRRAESTCIPFKISSDGEDEELTHTQPKLKPTLSPVHLQTESVVQTESTIVKDATTDAHIDQIETQQSITEYMEHSPSERDETKVPPCIVSPEFVKVLMAGMERKFDERLERLR